MDPATILGLSYAGKEAVAVVAEFTKEIFGPSARAVGKGIAAPLEAWAERRAERAQSVVVEAALMLDSAGQSPQQVPGRILLPLLQAASLEEDPEFQRRWAALLANAASPTSANLVLPAYTEILRQLTPVQAGILQWMYDQGEQLVDDWHTSWPDFTRQAIVANFDLKDNYALLISDMERLQLIEPRRELESPHGTDMIDADQMWELVTTRWNSKIKYDKVGLTSLGINFLKACTPPQKST